MTKPTQKLATLSAAEVSTELVSKIAAHAPSAGEHSTAIPGLLLFRRTQATACYRAAVEPSLTVRLRELRQRVRLIDLCEEARESANRIPSSRR